MSFFPMPLPVRIALIGAIVGAALLTLSTPSFGQQQPTPDEARRLLETRPDLIAQLRREIAGSGLTPDQIRARLRAAGYPQDLLDEYLGAGRGSRSVRDTLAGPLPSEDILDALAALGIVDSVDTSELRGLLRRRRSGLPTRADTV